MSDALKIKLKPYQDRFIFSLARFPAIRAAWGTGKSLCGIMRAMLYSQHIPGNLGVVFRKEYTDLRDSTVQDFEKYTGFRPDSQRNVRLKNSSVIMFRHMEEVNNLQNINLGWFMIEQGEELETDEPFFMLNGRLRRSVQPDAFFKKYKLPERTGFIVANAGSDWIRNLWRGDRTETVKRLVATGLSEPDAAALADGFALTEATTYDNADVLPPDFIVNLKVIEVQKPAIYRRFVLNDDDVSDDEFTLIPRHEIEGLKPIHVFVPEDDTKRLIACDPSCNNPASGGDECVIYVFENSKIIDSRYLHIDDTMKIAGEIMVLSVKHQIDDVAIDVIGIGAGIAHRLKELKKHVIEVNSAEGVEEDKKEKYVNRRAEIWGYVSDKIRNHEVCYPTDDELRQQLSKLRYIPNSSGRIKLELKKETKKRIGRSPDRADAYVYGIWALQRAKPVNLLAMRRRKEALLGKQRKRELTYIGRSRGY